MVGIVRLSVALNNDFLVQLNPVFLICTMSEKALDLGMPLVGFGLLAVDWVPSARLYV